MCGLLLYINGNNKLEIIIIIIIIKYCQNKLFRADCKKLYNGPRQTYSNVINAPDRGSGELLEGNIWERTST